jgi:DNA-binding XRE family transcriptional regulator
MAKEPVGLILRNLRNMRRMSMEDLSERTGIKIQTISRYEWGDSDTGSRPGVVAKLPLCHSGAVRHPGSVGRGDDTGSRAGGAKSHKSDG